MYMSLPGLTLSQKELSLSLSLSIINKTLQINEIKDVLYLGKIRANKIIN